MQVAKTMERGKASSSTEIEQQRQIPTSRLRKIVAVASIAAGIQFGWALQLSLLTPYVQLLGIPHTWAAFIWLCGPVSGMLVQPIVGYHSDRCTSRFGRRRPFIAAGSSLVAIAVFLIGYAADLGYLFGDDLNKAVKIRAIVVFVIGFWILDVANNMLQGPCRALLADLSGQDSKRTRTANSCFSFFMAVGNVMGYAAGSYKGLHHMFPFTKTKACNVYCANLKSCFFLSIALLLTLTTVALSTVKEKSISNTSGGGIDGDGEDELEKGDVPVKEPFFGEVFAALKDLPKPTRILLVVTCLNWIAWFPFLLFDTDWMGKEVYGGTVNVGKSYDTGVHAGALGLMLNSVVLGVTSLGIEFMGRRIGGVKRLWGAVNFLLALCLALTVVITKQAKADRHRHGASADHPSPPSTAVLFGALALFSVMGIPLAVTYSVPFAMASIFSNATGAGQGLSLGVLNLAIVVPQMLVSVASGPWDAIFGGGNLPAFVVGAVAATASGILALTLLPSPQPDQPRTKNVSKLGNDPPVSS